MWHLPLKLTEIPICTTVNQGWVLDFRTRVKIAESCPKTLDNLWYVIYAIYGLEKEPVAPMFVHVTSKKGPYILHILHKKFTCWKQFKFFILSGNLLLRECPFHIANCLKLFDFTVFFVYTLIALFWKTYDLLQSLRLQSGSSASKQNNAKTKCESLKEGPRDISEKEGPRGDASFASPNIHPCSRLHTKERTGFIL